MATPLTRYSEVDGDAVTCYTKSCPHYYMNAAGALLPVDLTLEDDTIPLGPVAIRRANVVSVGHRRDGNATKLIGLRPDRTQEAGTEQLEFSFVDAAVDGTPLSINLNARVNPNANTTAFDGKLYLRTNRQSAQIGVAVPKETTSFEMNVDLTLTGLYSAEVNGEFWFYGSADDEFKFRIRLPRVITTDGGYVRSTGLQHSLIGNRYRKWADALSFSMAGGAAVPDTVVVDAATYFSTTADGQIQHEPGVVAWAACIAAGTATGPVVDNVASVASSMQSKGVIPPGLYFCYRSFFYFDTSAVNNPTAVDLMLYGITNGDSDVCAMKGTQSASLVVADFDAFSGTAYGNAGGWNPAAYNTISFNATGVSEIVTSGETKICTREFTYDYGASDPGNNEYTNGCYFAEETGTSKDPTLVITVGLPFGSRTTTGVGL